jgi:hypothetical protein
MNEEKEEKKEDSSSYVFVGCILIGVALGMYLGNVGMGSVLGVGVGFLAKYFVTPKK